MKISELAKLPITRDILILWIDEQAASASELREKEVDMNEQIKAAELISHFGSGRLSSKILQDFIRIVEKAEGFKHTNLHITTNQLKLARAALREHHTLEGVLEVIALV